MKFRLYRFNPESGEPPHMQDVELLVPDNIHDGRSQGGIVRGVFKEGIVFIVYLVIEHIFVKMRQSDRASVGDKVYFMASAGEP